MRLRAFVVLAAIVLPVAGQDVVTVRPREIDDVLVNPGMGFTTFQRFNGDKLNPGTKWTEGYPIEYQVFTGNLHNENHPDTSIAYFRVYWKFVEPEEGRYNWGLLDKALSTAHARGQALMLRVAPYGTAEDNDVPAWYRKITGEVPNTKLADPKWRVDPENPNYARYFGRMVRALGARYDGDPRMDLVDISVVGAWGEGAGSERLSQPVLEALHDAYIESFRKTPLVIQPKGARSNGYVNSKAAVGWRVDCLGDMGGFSKTWCHMYDYYPQTIIQAGLAGAWKKAPVTMEACWVMQHWKDQGWDVDYIIGQSLKWHISSFNNKSSAVPAEWKPKVDQWLKKMGYRLVLRKFTFPAAIKPGGKLSFTSWWENKGVAPCYRAFPFAIRLKGSGQTLVLMSNADIRTWLPGDSLYDDALFVPADLAAGDYEVSVAIVDAQTRAPVVKLAIAGRDSEGWYPLGRMTVVKASE